MRKTLVSVGSLRVGLDRAIKLEFHGAKVSSDAGLFPCRDLDEAALLPKRPEKGLQASVLGPDSACHRRVRSEASDWNLSFRGVLRSCS